MTDTDRQILESTLAAHAQWLGAVDEGRRAHLREANLRWADLQGADLREANLRWADLQGADLRGAHLRGANLQGADLGAVRVVQLGPLGSRRDSLTVIGWPDGRTEARTGCFRGSLEDLARAVEETHREEPRYRDEYRAAITYCRTVLAWQEET